MASSHSYKSNNFYSHKKVNNIHKMADQVMILSPSELKGGSKSFTTGQLMER